MNSYKTSKILKHSSDTTLEFPKKKILGRKVNHPKSSHFNVILLLLLVSCYFLFCKNLSSFLFPLNSPTRT